MEATHEVKFWIRGNPSTTKTHRVLFRKAEGQEQSLWLLIDVTTEKAIGMWDKARRMYSFPPEVVGHLVEELKFRHTKNKKPKI